ncbi:SCO4848 family membrane protein [Solicola sp. PLA-1-18]|uniref:SCO4848 family membrane protein n=1 Tax=Solicola sp. PLA-1-18 TaxID=3380532 RepID=UPI003B76532B
MDVPAAVAVLLLVAGAWSLVVWPPFLRRVLKDPRSRDASGSATRFLTVHVVLVTVSMALGLSTAVVGLAALLQP